MGNGDDFMKKVALGLYGAGGFGREVAALLPTIISKLFPGLLSKDFLIIFIDDNSDVSEVNGKKIVSKDDFLKLTDYELCYCVTIADCKTRKLVVERVSAEERGVDWHKENNLLDETHAIHGGGLPLITKDDGFVGVLLISGLPQVEDHLLGVEVLTEFLARKGELL